MPGPPLARPSAPNAAPGSARCSGRLPRAPPYHPWPSREEHCAQLEVPLPAGAVHALRPSRRPTAKLDVVGAAEEVRVVRRERRDDRIGLGRGRVDACGHGRAGLVTDGCGNVAARVHDVASGLFGCLLLGHPPHHGAKPGFRGISANSTHASTCSASGLPGTVRPAHCGPLCCSGTPGGKCSCNRDVYRVPAGCVRRPSRSGRPSACRGRCSSRCAGPRAAGPGRRCGTSSSDLASPCGSARRRWCATGRRIRSPSSRAGRCLTHRRTAPACGRSSLRRPRWRRRSACTWSPGSGLGPAA